MSKRPELNKWNCVSCKRRKTTDKFEHGQPHGKKVCLLCAAQADEKATDPDFVIRRGLNLRRVA